MESSDDSCMVVPPSTIKKLDDQFQTERELKPTFGLQDYLSMFQQILSEDDLKLDAFDLVNRSMAVQVRHEVLLEWLKVNCGMNIVDEASEVTRSKQFERRSVIVRAAGHEKSVKKDKSNPDFILKPYDAVEARNYDTIDKAKDDPIRDFVGSYGGVETHNETDAASPDQAPKKFMRIANLLANRDNPCVMDCKLGVRTFQETELNSKKQRADLYENLLKLDSSLITDEERERGAITKHKWMATRDATSSSSTLGFRIDGICSREGQRADTKKELQKLREVSDIVPMLLRVLPPRIRNDSESSARRRLDRTRDLIERLKALHAALQTSPFFNSHECIGTSVLFVVDKERADVHLIDFAKTEPLPEGVHIDHRSAWIRGNHEDGVLTGVESLLRLWNQALAALEDESGTQMLADSKLERQSQEIEALLKANGVEIKAFGSEESRGLEELVWELQVERSVSLELDGKGCIRRAVEIVKAWIIADAGPDDKGETSPHVLMDMSRNSPFARKLGAGESWEEALQRALTEQMGLTAAQQERHFRVQPSTYMLSHEERMGHARGGFPGLRSLYHVHEVDVHVVDPSDPELAFMGLPKCANFSTVLNFNPLLGSEVKKWDWSPKWVAGHASRGTVAGFPRGSRPTAYDLRKGTPVLSRTCSNMTPITYSLPTNGLWPGTEKVSHAVDTKAHNGGLSCCLVPEMAEKEMPYDQEVHLGTSVVPTKVGMFI